MKKITLLLSAVLFTVMSFAGVVTFTPADFEGQGTTSTGSPVTVTKDGVTVSCDKGYGTSYALRCYTDGVVTISATENIASLEFAFDTYNGRYYNGNLEESYTVGANTWDVKLTSQARFKSITVTLGEGGTTTPDEPGTEEPETPDTPEVTGMITCAEAATIAAAENYVGSEDVTVYGYVVELGNAKDDGSKQCFYMSDTKGGEKQFMAYWAFVPQLFKVGDYVTVTGPLKNYKGTIEIVDGQAAFLGDTPETPDTPDTTFVGVSAFSIAANKQVTFSKGNLQYHPANDEWRFAPSQLDYIGDANSNCSSTYNGWLDLFGWSTSATNFGVSTSTDWENDYLGSFVDWGTNKIGNDAPNTWRTLTFNEWGYLLNNRPNASSLKGVAQVNGVNGLILLPDNWTCPSGVTFKSGSHSERGVEYYAAYQTFTAAEWSKLEAAGAVFLPAAGRRYGTDVSYVQDYSVYWSATDEYHSYMAYYLYFYSAVASMDYLSCSIGHSIRLVKDLQ